MTFFWSATRDMAFSRNSRLPRGHVADVGVVAPFPNGGARSLSLAFWSSVSREGRLHFFQPEQHAPHCRGGLHATTQPTRGLS